PTEKLDVLGFTIDATAMPLSASANKIRYLRREATKMLNIGFSTLKSLSAFVGEAIAATLVIFQLD
ncbi:hypothetical protein BGZ83_006377, partial [Gryganskiella cystojenkinii]